MKKWLALLLAACMALSMVACGGDPDTTTADAGNQTTAAPQGGNTETEPVEDDATYTYNGSLSEFPTNWNPHIYQTATDAEILDYIVDGFFTFDYNENRDGYALVPSMAVADPVDVTAEYAAQFGLAADATAQIWKITLRDDLKWEDGTPIVAKDFVTSAELLLNPAAQNYRADTLYSGNLKVINAKNYLYQGQTVKEDNGVTGAYAVADLVVGDTYTTPDGGNVYLAVNYALDWTSGNTLNDYVAAYGDTYFDVTNWETLMGMANDEGLIPLTKEAYDLFIPVITGNPAWGETEADVVNYLIYESTYPEMSFDKVGIFAPSELELVIAMEAKLEGFYLNYALTSSWLVKEDLYKSCESVVDGIYTNTYGTAAENTISYGPYKLTSFQADKQYILERNDNFHGMGEGLYQTTHIQIDCVEEASTRLEMLLKGQLDSYGLTVEDMETYQSSDYCYYSTGDSTFFVALNPDKDALATNQAALGENYNKTILTVKEFRQALAYAIDRAAFALATAPTNSPAFGLFSSLIVSDPVNGVAYRTTEEAKWVLARFWGLADDIGEGKLYATVDDAVESITGYNLEMAKQMFDAAYDIAIADGLMDADDVVSIMIGTPNGTSNFYNKGYDYLVNCYTDAVKGTKLEGKLVFTRDDTLGNGFSDALKQNKVDMLFGVGWTGSALDPYGLMEAYTGSNYQYDPCWDTTTAMETIKIDGVDYTASVWDWTLAIMGNEITITAADGTTKAFSAGSSDGIDDVRFMILTVLENAVLETYDLIPLIDDASATLKGMQITYGAEEYVFGMGFGTVKYYTYNYSDAEWTDFVASQGGSLNYN